VARRKCPECAEYLLPNARSNQVTCGKAACRQGRARRKARSQKKQGVRKDTTLEPMREAIRGDIVDVAHEVAKEEIRPAVREAITEDVLDAVKKLVGLTPLMVTAIEQDLVSEVSDIRQRAYTLLARYTLGNPSVAPASAEQQPAAMNVIFNMPRPGDETPELSEDTTAAELKTCTECKTEKPSDEFVANSERCVTCHEDLQARVLERFGA
jgi:hypothetical protein